MDADRVIRERVEQLGQNLEGGGLMIPLDERRQRRNTKVEKRKSTESTPAISASADVSAGPSVRALKVAQYDGVDESDEDEKGGIIKHDSDEDAINSDLDDPNDIVGQEEEDDEGAGQIMLCTYDKVQRVKNKWKCTLKDGVLTTNGKESDLVTVFEKNYLLTGLLDTSFTKLRESLNGSQSARSKPLVPFGLETKFEHHCNRTSNITNKNCDRSTRHFGGKTALGASDPNARMLPSRLSCSLGAVAN